MLSFAYARLELRRMLRNVRLMVLSLGFPLVLYLVVAMPGRDVQDLGGSGISLPLYFMVGLVAFGAMMAQISTGARIATERTTGWTRQLRVTPLSARAYLCAKVLTGYVMAGLTIATLYAAGVALGVGLPLQVWVEMTALLGVGLLPFAALGVLLGHLFTAEVVGPAAGGLTSLLALVSGAWFPLPEGGLLDSVAQYLPSYWLVQASHVSVGGEAWGTAGWVTVAAWTVALGAAARVAYRRDTERV
jgi:ABC-2 type transport system permease protein